jgi:hypothetical protein
MPRGSRHLVLQPNLNRRYAVVCAKRLHGNGLKDSEAMETGTMGDSPRSVCFPDWAV